VKGKPEQSGLFDWSRPLARDDQTTMRSFEALSGFSGSLTRAGVARTTDIDDDTGIQQWLRDGAAAMVNDSQSLFSYVVATDTGFAPNPYHGYCSVATCKPEIRSAAEPGDWVIGCAPAGANQDTVVFVMQVDEKLSYHEYYDDELFKPKRPGGDSPGYNIYYRDDGQLVQVENPAYHDLDEDREHDTQTDAVLIGSLFWYFGEHGYEVPMHLREDLLHANEADGRVGHSREGHLESLKILVGKIQTERRMGKHGAPRDGDGRPGC
jgi:hypothetical protein